MANGVSHRPRWSVALRDPSGRRSAASGWSRAMGLAWSGRRRVFRTNITSPSPLPRSPLNLPCLCTGATPRLISAAAVQGLWRPLNR